MTRLDHILGQAYLRRVRSHPAPHAVIATECRGDPALLAEARAKRDHLAKVVKARSVGGRCSCHIEKAHLENLTDALASLEAA